MEKKWFKRFKVLDARNFYRNEREKAVLVKSPLSGKNKKELGKNIQFVLWKAGQRERRAPTIDSFIRNLQNRFAIYFFWKGAWPKK